MTPENKIKLANTIELLTEVTVDVYGDWTKAIESRAKVAEAEINERLVPLNLALRTLREVSQME